MPKFNIGECFRSKVGGQALGHIEIEDIFDNPKDLDEVQYWYKWVPHANSRRKVPAHGLLSESYIERFMDIIKISQ